MEPQIRYARTTDGVGIAWYAIGSGAPYVWPSSPQGAGLADAWRIAELRSIFEGIARRATFVTLDPRGFGLSDRNATDYSSNAMVRDLEAVADAANLGAFILQAFGYMCIPALHFAARHPDRIRALVLLNGVLRGSDLSDGWRRLLQLAAEDWEYARTLLARTNEASYASTLTLEHAEQLLAHGASQESFVDFSRAMAAWDASPVVSQVQAPSLVVHYGPPASQTPLDACRRLAAVLPRGTFVPVESRDAGATRGERVESVVLEWLRGVTGSPPRQPVGVREVTGTAVILFVDIAGSSALTEAVGDAAFRTASRALDDDLRTAIRASGGNPVDGKVLGDGVMGLFQSAAMAIRAALACRDASTAAGLQLHVGIHAGDVIHERNNVYGGAVNIAARICELSEPGEVLVSGTVRELARTSAGVAFLDHGDRPLKGITDPVHVFAVGSSTS